jgi:hypothetical protein
MGEMLKQPLVLADLTGFPTQVGCLRAQFL